MQMFRLGFVLFVLCELLEHEQEKNLYNKPSMTPSKYTYFIMYSKGKMF